MFGNAFRHQVDEASDLRRKMMAVRIDRIDRELDRLVVFENSHRTPGLDPDQRPIEFTGTAVWAVREDGKLLHNWVERSARELYQTLTRA